MAELWGRVFALSLGGVVGVNARYWLGIWISRWAGPQFPWATFTINVSGALLIGFLATVLDRWSPHSQLRLILIVGFLGGYTTFSTFAFESVTLGQRGEWGLALAYMIGSVAAGCVAVLVGAALATSVFRPAWNPNSALRESSKVQTMPPQASPVSRQAEGQRTGADTDLSSRFARDGESTEGSSQTG